MEENPRPRIAAMESGPGPGAYFLPGTTGHYQHDPSKTKNPAYTFGTKTKQFSTMNYKSIRCFLLWDGWVVYI